MVDVKKMFVFCFYLRETREEKPLCFVFHQDGIFATEISNGITNAVPVDCLRMPVP